MRLRLIWVGKTRDARLRALVDEYLKRLSRFVRCEVTELRESSAEEPRACLEEEGKRITGALASDALTILLDVSGKTSWSSEELAARVEEWEGRSVKEGAVVVGGPPGVSAGGARGAVKGVASGGGGRLGVAEERRRRAQVRWPLSRLTLTHEMARVVLTEQLYRAYTIARGLPYQK